jgi:hypothetical protein
MNICAGPIVAMHFLDALLSRAQAARRDCLFHFHIVQPKSGSWTGRSVWFLGCRARRNDAEWCDREDTLLAVNNIF